MLRYYKLAYHRKIVFRVVFWMCLLSIMKLCLDFCVGKTVLQFEAHGNFPVPCEDWVSLKVRMEAELVDSGRKAACLRVFWVGISSWQLLVLHIFGGAAGRQNAGCCLPSWIWLLRVRFSNFIETDRKALLHGAEE